MNTKHVFWVVSSGVAIASATVGIAACSSAPTTVYPDAGRPDSSSGTDGKADSSTADTSTADTSTSDAGCANPPKLFPPTANGVFCPFGKSDAGKTEYCKADTQVCCVSPSNDAGSSTCNAPGTCPTGWGDWACSAPQECSGTGVVCCLAAGPLQADPNCGGFQKTKGFSSTTCMPSAKCTGTIDAGKFTDNLYVACEAPADCPQGKTCTAIKSGGTSIGVCL